MRKKIVKKVAIKKVAVFVVKAQFIGGSSQYTYRSAVRRKRGDIVVCDSSNNVGIAMVTDCWTREEWESRHAATWFNWSWVIGSFDIDAMRESVEAAKKWCAK